MPNGMCGEKFTFLPFLHNSNENTTPVILPSILCAGNNWSLYTKTEYTKSASE
jgi:hypothetical protein